MRDISNNEQARVRQLIEDGERRVAAQQKMVDQLRSDGQKASGAEEIILRTMKDALHHLRQQIRQAHDRT